MITYHIESFSERLEELKALLPLHYEELALNKDKVPLSPQYEVYVDRERQGMLLFVTARDAGQLVGYFIGFVAPGLHYSTCLTCIMDIFYIAPDHRGSNAGFQLFKFVEKELKRRRVQRWFMGAKVHFDCSFLFEKLGAELVEKTYSLMLED
jgi:GNAT superfamily N-acetyltransferase